MTARRTILAYAAAASLSLAVACKDPAADKPAAQIEPAHTPATTPQALTAGGESLVLSSDTSSISFVGSKVTGSHHCSVESFTGTIELADGQAAGGKVTVKLDLNTLQADADRLTGHLKSADFFDVENHPTGSFVSTAVVAGGADGATHTMTGNLTLRGTERSITFPANITVTDGEVTAKAEFSIDRQQFGISYAGHADDLIRDNVVVQLDIKAMRKMM